MNQHESEVIKVFRGTDHDGGLNFYLKVTERSPFDLWMTFVKYMDESV